MSEIVCPSCQSRYQIPEGAIGPEGRKVKCASCAHVWLAVPETVAAGGEDVVPEPVPEPVAEAAVAADVVPEPVIAPEPEPEAAASSFEDRLAALRGELRAEDEAAAIEEAVETPAPSRFGDDDPSRTETGRFLEPEPQAGRPDYDGDDKAYDDPHEVEGAALEPYGADEEPVVYDDMADRAPVADTAPAAEAPARPRAMAGLPPDEDFADEEYAEYDDDQAPVAASANPEVEAERKDQMDEIRQMLDELQGEDAGSPEGEVEYGANLERPDPIPSRPYEEDEYRDPLRERLAEVSGGAAIPAFRKNAKHRDYDRNKLMKTHQRRYRRKRSAEMSSRPSPFLTGFMLMIMVGLLMGTVYLLHPQIIARVPESEPAMLEYVQFIDGLRVVVGEKIEALRGMIDQAIEKAA